MTEILERVSSGEPLAQVCRDDHTPALRTFYDWLEADPALSARFARARETGFEIIAHDVLRIADADCESYPTEHGERRDPGFVAWQRARIDARLKLLAKWDPKRYGDRLEQSGSVEVVHRIHIGPRPE